MTGPLLPDRTLPVNADVAGPYDVSAMTALARRAWASLEEHGQSPTVFAAAPAFHGLLSGRVARAWGLRPPRRGDPPPCSAARVASDLERDRLGRTTIWPHGRSWFVAGELAEPLRAELARLGSKLELARPSFLPALAARLREQRNPWQHRPRWFIELSHHSMNECGVGLDSRAWFWLSAVMLRECEGLSHRLPGDDPHLMTRAREQLSALLERRRELSEAQAWIVFVLRAARDSEMVILRANADFSAWRAVVHVTAGRVIRLGYTYYPLEEAASLSMTSEPVGCHRHETHLDGGNVHLRVLELDPIELLDGGRSPPAARRHAR